MSVVTDPQREAKAIIPVDVFLQLEQMVQDLRLRVIECVEGTTDDEQRASIRSALAKVAESPRVFIETAQGDKPSKFQLTSNGYLFLENRLHNLRVLVIRTADTMARQNRQDKVNSTLLQAAWDQILSDDRSLRSALLSESTRTK
jgi:hypothetical protein